MYFFTEETVKWIKNDVLVQNMFMNGLNMDLTLHDNVEKKIRRVEKLCFCKEKMFHGQ